MRRVLLAAILIVTACRSTRLQSHGTVPQLLAKANVPGAAVAVIHRGQVNVRSYGVADVESKKPVDEHTVFEAASMGKVVFAYGVMKLVERGKLDLDRPLQSYLSAPYIADPRAGAITARLVLSHRTGFPNWRGSNKELQLIADPGTRFGYSGEGFLFLGKAVEAITGEPVETYMRREVFDPLRMNDTTYIWLPSYDEHKAWGHKADGTRWRRRKPEAANVAATLQTTAADFGKFIAALASHPELSMFAPQTDVPEACAMCSDRPANAPVAPDLQWGLGIALMRPDFFWHWGDNGDFKGYMFGSRASGDGVVVLTNGANGLAIAGDIARVVMGDAALRPLAWLGYVKAK